MKYITFAVIAVLMFGMAIAPSIHDGLVFAQTGEENEMREEISEDKKTKEEI